MDIPADPKTPETGVKPVSSLKKALGILELIGPRLGAFIAKKKYGGSVATVTSSGAWISNIACGFFEIGDDE